ncbi:hypothetical protein ACI3K4_27600 [Streptomyces sp. CSMPJR101]|uniref:hypothetical protein n=1 Tax=Streptomyces sp. CSMPJR101 TaxID=1279378 RepID=UPI0038532CF7
MPQIKLANWYGDKAPGETIDVDEVTAKALRRDGLVAQPEQETPQEKQAPAPVAEEPAQPQPAVEAGAEAEQSGRRKR